MQEIDALAEIKVDVIALDATLRPRPDGKTIDELIVAAKNKYPNLLFMADCSSEEDVKHANELPFDLIGTTLRGHTKETNGKSNIADDFAFIKTILNFVTKPLIVEGGIWEPAQVKRAFAIGASTVVVGSAITRPKLIVEHWMKEIK
jgi:N-acylglucosamine-6-phosphate 2-epimerase